MINLNMKIIFILFFYMIFIFFSYAQDTISIKIKDIKTEEYKIKSTKVNFPSIIKYRKINTLFNTPLNGCYKVKIGIRKYYIAYFKDGNFDISGGRNIIKYYVGKRIKKIHISSGNYYLLLSKQYFTKDSIITLPIIEILMNEEKCVGTITIGRESVKENINTLLSGAKDNDVEAYISL